MAHTPIEKKIKDMLQPAAEDVGFRVVAVQLGQDGAMPLLQILAEDPTTGRINLDECAGLSREFSAILDVEDPISSAYRLEVSSPGIDRPLFTTEEFSRYVEEEVKVELVNPVTENGQKKIRGHIKSVTDGKITVICDGEDFTFTDDNIAKAKLVLTDNLIKNTRKAAS